MVNIASMRQAWLYVKSLWQEQDTKQLAINELLKQQRQVDERAILAYLNRDMLRWLNLQEESERIDRQIAAIEFSKEVNDSELG